MSNLDLGHGHTGARPLRACMLAYTFYDNDGRVMRYAEALANQGADVEVIALRRDHQPADEVVNGIRICRIQRREKNESGKYSYLSRILMFFFLSMREVTRRHLKNPYDIIHVHSVPDFEVFAAFVPKLKQAKIILDIHDIVPEFYSAKFNVSQDSLVFKALKLVEKFSTGFADHVIISNDLWLDKITSRSVRREKCSALINYPDLSVFRSDIRTRNDDGRFIMIYPGTLNWHQGLDIAVKAFALAKENIPRSEFHIYGEGSSKPEIRRLVEDLQLSNKILIKPPLPLREIACIMANADLGIVPKRNDSFGGEAFSTKILEFMALGVPVVVADTRIDKRYFNESIVRFFKAGDENDLARAMVEAYKDRDLNSELTFRALEYAHQNSWSRRRGDYLAIVERLVDDSR
ncbi:MAG: glycosyltransferase family 4 protein [Nitrososphaera sp.]|nr:glycosyltransferase family 4 protein [Nitrososphaera sp.]